MRKSILLVTALAIANLGQAPAVKGGTVKGRVVVMDKAKPRPVGSLWVYLESSKWTSVSIGAGVVATVEQKDQEFVPRVTVIPIGAKVRFPNRDSKEHNVFSPAGSKDWLGFDLGRYGKSATGRTQTFNERGSFDIYCDVHKNMRAKVKTVPTRYFARVVNDTYEIRDVPPGTYHLFAWTPEAKNEPRTARPFTVVAGAAVELEELHPQYAAWSPDHSRIDDSPYDWKDYGRD